MRRSALIVALFGLWQSIALAPQAVAHNKSLSYSEWSIREDKVVHALITLPARQATLLLAEVDESVSVEAAAHQHFRSQLKVYLHQQPCHLNAPVRSLSTVSGRIVFEMQFDCSEPVDATLIIENNSFFAHAARHLHFARFKLTTGAWQEAAMTTSARRFAPLAGEQQQSKPSTLPDFFVSGIAHILTGIDHLIFLVGLLLIVGSKKELIWAITGFTLGHSLSLMVLASGLIGVNESRVEAMIALTIWLVGVEALGRRYPSNQAQINGLAAALLGLWTLIQLIGWPAGSSLPFLFGLILLSAGCLELQRRYASKHIGVMVSLTLLFGAIHGLGFAGALLDTLDRPVALGWHLFAFNIGVEVGQLLFIVSCFALGYAMRTLHPNTQQYIMFKTAAVTLILGMGAFWFVDRTLL